MASHPPTLRPPTRRSTRACQVKYPSSTTSPSAPTPSRVNRARATRSASARVGRSAGRAGGV
ncbi:MAG: hypothetical protein M3Q48_14265, partial [Actinomycetota bacterium]|nr:hypothetical protein [Actinomycetota bacterium]